MNLIDETYFTGTIALPGVKRLVAGGKEIPQTVGETDLKRFIEEFQEEYLNELIGESLSEALFAGLALPEGDPGKEIWLALKNKLVDEAKKASPIANYVYYFVMRYGRTQTAPTGEKKARSDFAKNVSGDDKIILAWNKMVEWNFRFVEWMENNAGTYKEYRGNHSVNMEGDLFKPLNAFNL